MNHAQRIVFQLLEGPPPLKDFRGMLLHPRKWPNFWDLDSHGTFRFLERVDDADQEMFCDALKRLREFLAMNNIVMPAGKWCLKMPMGYGILGTGVVGGTVLGKNMVMARDNQAVDNPMLSPTENRTWKTGL